MSACAEQGFCTCCGIEVKERYDWGPWTTSGPKVTEPEISYRGMRLHVSGRMAYVLGGLIRNQGELSVFATAMLATKSWNADSVTVTNVVVSKLRKLVHNSTEGRWEIPTAYKNRYYLRAVETP